MSARRHSPAIIGLLFCCFYAHFINSTTTMFSTTTDSIARTMPAYHRRRRRVSAAASLVALAALQATTASAQRVDHPWRCCGIRQNPLNIKPTDEIAFAIDGEADVWEFDDEEAYKSCDFSRARQIVADASGKAVASPTGAEKVRYFSSKKGCWATHVPSTNGRSNWRSMSRTETPRIPVPVDQSQHQQSRNASSIR